MTSTDTRKEAVDSASPVRKSAHITSAEIDSKPAATSPGYRLKRTLDLAILLGSLIALAPFWILIWVTVPAAIWLSDRGPVFYRQARIGRGGREFDVLKFRTMRAKQDGEEWPDRTSNNDSRVTFPGEILRRTALDELPQLINILRGELSFVGPRPLAVMDYMDGLERDSEFHQRVRVSPGLTGLAQLYLPRNCGPVRRRRYDSLYIRNASLWLDLKLIGRSIAISFAGRWGSGARRSEID